MRLEESMVTVDQFQNILKTKSTTFVRTICERYCLTKGYEKWSRNPTPEKWYYAQYDCKRRLRTIFRFFDGEHELNITMRKKAGYYFLIEYDRHRIFECEPSILVHDEEALNMVTEKYKDLFDLLVA